VSNGTLFRFMYPLLENDKEMSRIHHDLAISYMPDDEPKALLCTAAMYVEVGRLEEGCVIYREMYKTVDEMEAQYRPYVLNNYGKDADVVYYKYRCTGLLGLLAVFSYMRITSCCHSGLQCC
jgi:hypothetical protein